MTPNVVSDLSELIPSQPSADGLHGGIHGIDGNPFRRPLDLIGEEDEQEWLIDGLLHDSIKLLYGKPKAGKTHLATAIAVAVTQPTGSTFLGRTVVRGGRAERNGRRALGARTGRRGQ